MTHNKTWFQPLWAVLFILFFWSCSSTQAPPQEVNDLRNKAADFTLFGNQYFQQAQFEQALNFFTLALQNNILIDNLSGMAASYNSVGRTYLAMDRIPEAQRAFMEAKTLAEELGNNGLIAQSANNLSEILIRKGQVDDAIGELERTLTTVTQGAEKETAVLYQSLGAALRKKSSQLSAQGKTQEASDILVLALGKFQKAAELNKSQGLWREYASNHYMIASVHLKSGALDQALTSVQTALENDRKMENSLGIAQDLRLMGEVSHRRGEKTQALGYHLRAYQIFLNLGIDTQASISLDFVIPLLEQSGRNSDADNYRGIQRNLNTAGSAAP